jgi:hypothetical protein
MKEEVGKDIYIPSTLQTIGDHSAGFNLRFSEGCGRFGLGVTADQTLK